MVDGAIVVGSACPVFTLIGIVAVTLANLTGLADRAGVLHPDAGTIVAGTVLAGLIVLPILLVAGYYVAVVTSPIRPRSGQPRRPDHHEPDGPRGRRRRLVRYGSIRSDDPWMTNRRASRTCSSRLKDASELMVDLAYAAVFFNDEKLAREVERLDERMNAHLRRLREVAMLAARSPEDAEGMAGVLWIADAVEKVGEAASDIARVIEARLGIPDAVRRDLRPRRRDDGAVKVRSGAAVIGRSLRDLSLPTETGMWVMAIRSGIDWQFDPGPDDVISEDDVLLVRGPRKASCCSASSPGAPASPDPGGGGAAALRARPRGRPPRRAEGPLGGGRRARVLLDPVQQPRARGRGRRARGPERHPAGRARVVGAARGAGGEEPGRAPRPPAPRRTRASRCPTPRAT